MVNSRAQVPYPVPDIDDTETSGIHHMALASRSITMDFSKLARIIQDGIMAGLLGNT